MGWGRAGSRLWLPYPLPFVLFYTLQFSQTITFLIKVHCCNDRLSLKPEDLSLSPHPHLFLRYSHCVGLAGLDSLCRLAWPWSWNRLSCLCHRGVGITGVYHHVQPKKSLLRCFSNWVPLSTCREGGGRVSPHM